MADEQSNAKGEVQDPESGLGTVTQDTDENNSQPNEGIDSNNSAQNTQSPQIEDIGSDSHESNDDDDNMVFSRKAYRALMRDRAQLEALKNEATAQNYQISNSKDLVNKSLNKTTYNDANITNNDNGTVGTNDHVQSTSNAQHGTVQHLLPQNTIDTSVRPKTYANVVTSQGTNNIRPTHTVTQTPKTYASIVCTPSQNNSPIKPALSQPTVSNQNKQQSFINNKFNKFRNVTGTRPSNLHNTQWSNKNQNTKFHLTMLSQKLSTLNFKELNKIKSLLNKKIQYKQFQFSYAKNPLTVFTANKLRKLIYERIPKSHPIADKEAQNNLGFNQIQYYVVEGILFRLSRLHHTLRDKVITEYEKEPVINYVCKETNCYHCANGSIERIYIEILIAEFGPKYHSFINKNKRLNKQLCILDQLPSKEDKQVSPHVESIGTKLTKVQKVMTNQSTQTITINNKNVDLQTDMTTQNRHVSLVNQEVQTMTLDNVISDETNKLTQGPSTDDLTSTSCNNTPGLGELNNTSTEQIKIYTNTEMSSRDKDQHYNSKYPCNIKIDSLTHDLLEYNLSFGKKYINFLDRAVKDESIYINEKLDQCYFSALQDYQQANFNMVETKDQLDVIFLRNDYDFNNWASYIYQLCGVLTNQEKLEMEHRLDYVIALEKISKRKKPIHYNEILSLFGQYFSFQTPHLLVETNDPDSDEQNESDGPDTDTEVKIEIRNPTPTLTPNTSNHDISFPTNRKPDSKLTSHEETSSTKVVTSKKQQPIPAVPDSKYINKSSAEEANQETEIPKLSPVIQRNKLPDFSPALNELNKSPKGYYPPPQNYFSPSNNNNFNNNFNNLNNTPINDRTSYTPPYGDKKYIDLINENASPLKQPNFNFSPRKQEVPTNEGLNADQALSPKRELISDCENESSVQPIPELQQHTDERPQSRYRPSSPSIMKTRSQTRKENQS
ncbi:unnamed protein product [Rotaria magnacalcarata]|uniref:Uncharacterized protein n=1 Tax=Rotaria magnacalcarata TaxID=392030 RepID=A0A816VTA8_9BILA|nr:unnamed protein product [Rotaria magnacalcarata]